MDNLEIEYKVMINKDGFLKLKEVFSSFSKEYKEQINYYYDTKTFDLKQNKLSLRIRHIVNENSFIATLKEKIKDGHLEHEYYVDGCDFNKMPKQIINILNEKNIATKDICLLGTLKTNRLEIKYKNGILCIDHNLYNENEDYEVEFECDNLKYGEKIVSDLLNENNIIFKKSKNSKIQRCLKNTIINI